MIFETVDRLLKERGTTMQWLSEQIGCTRSGLFRALKNETLRVNQLRKICIILNVSSDDLLQINSEKKELKELKHSIDLMLKKLESQP